MMMKDITKQLLQGLLVFTLALPWVACTKDFGKINTNPLNPGPEEIQRDNIAKLGAFLPDLQTKVVFLEVEKGKTNQVNNYQILNNLTAENWVGYMAPGENKWPGISLTQYYFDVNWNNMGFGLIGAILNPWLQVKNETMTGDVKNELVFSIAQICKIMGLHKATDMFGAIPYSQSGSGAFTVAYDSQEEVYTSFLKELERAVEVLSALDGAAVRTTDYVYNGNSTQWVKLGNSLMLRLAMRLSYVKPDMAKEYAQKAINHHIGVIESVADEAKIASLNGAPAYHTLAHIVDTYALDARMGGTIQVYLKGYQDLRMDKYFKGNTDVAIPPAVPSGATSYESAGIPNFTETSPTVWMRASEVAFLKAEAILKGFVAGSAKTEYERGIKLSFEEHEIPEADYAEYIKSAKSPASFEDKVNPRYSSKAPSGITPMWDDNATPEVKLERIITQKYLALFPNGQEAWSEWRRTGYPRLLPSLSSISNFGVKMSDGHKDGVRCWPYPPNEFTLNGENVRDAINKYKGGSNNANINVWWDVKEKN